MNSLINKIKTKKAVIGIIGLGYVGLPLAMTFAKKFKVIGFDIDTKKEKMLNEGKSYIDDVLDEEIKEKLGKSFFPISNSKELKNADFIIICVPTPIDERKKPDIKYIVNSTKIIAEILHKEQFVILESTTYPGTTEEVMIPILEETGLKVGKDFGIAFSPERIDPGNKIYKIENTPKIVGGYNQECTEIAYKLYSSVIQQVIKVKNCKTAEAVKVVENLFRGVNIALVNELALIFEKMEIDIWEVINSAKTKPYGFLAHYPGPGIGGHCIPVDPYYLSYKAERLGYVARFIQLSGQINDFMKIHVINLIEKGLAEKNKKLRNSTICVFGTAYKKDISDARESPSKEIIEELVSANAKVKVYDKFVKTVNTIVGKFDSEKNLENAFKGIDCAVFVVDHSSFKNIDLQKYKKLMASPIIIDCRNIFEGKNLNGFIYYCIGKPR